MEANLFSLSDIVGQLLAGRHGQFPGYSVGSNQGEVQSRGKRASFILLYYSSKGSLRRRNVHLPNSVTLGEFLRLM